MERFSENLRSIMSDKGITQQRLSDAARVPRPNISRILCGEENVTLERAERLAKAVGFTLSEILSEKFPVSA